MQQQICWFCEKNTADPESAEVITLYRDVQYTGLTYKKTRKTWKEKEIRVPRCKQCARAEKTIRLFTWGGILAGTLAAGLFSDIFPDVNSPFAALGSGILVGLLIIQIGKAVIRGSGALDKIAENYPAVQEARENGWQLGLPE